MNIAQILEMPIGQKFGGFDIAIKTCKKKWEANGKWTQQIVMSDETGDAIADVNIERNIPLQRGSVLHITIGVIQASVAEVGKVGEKRIYIDQFVLPSVIGEPEIEYSMTDKITRSKIKCWLVSACLQNDSKQMIDRPKIDGLVDYIIK